MTYHFTTYCKFTDAIFEPNVIDLVKRLVGISVDYAPEVHKSLCHSYTGEPSKIQLISDLYNEFVSENVQPRAEFVCREALRKMVIDKFDANKIDEVAKSMEEVQRQTTTIITKDKIVTNNHNNYDLGIQPSVSLDSATLLARHNLRIVREISGQLFFKYINSGYFSSFIIKTYDNFYT